jgi:putative DNA primase/helicase
LAKLPPIDYDRIRMSEAARLGVRVGTLDSEVAKRRPADLAQTVGQGQPLVLNDPTPWPDPVDGPALLNDLVAAFERYLALGPYASHALALWVLHAFALSVATSNPRLAITSPQKRCGKTTLVSVLSKLVPRPLPAANITPAAVYRAIEACTPTLLLDEADTFLADNHELRGVLNSGHTRATAFVIRSVGDDHEPRRFATWCPMATAAIGRLPATLMDRSIIIEMRRRRPGRARGPH